MGTENAQPVSEPHEAQPIDTPAAAAQKAAPTGAAAASSKETFSTLEELRALNPEAYQKMMEGIAQGICIKIKRQNDRLKELQRKYRDKG